jgi:GNAT superfamily N-acetyltransferase
MTEIDGIRIIPFESRFQEQSAQLFIDGLSSYIDASSTVKACQQWFISTKLSEKGDMSEIYKSYMMSDDTCRHFWVAVDNEDRVLGQVGVIPSTYPNNDQLVYDRNDLNNTNVCELVRMSVHKDCRGKGLGAALCRTLEKFANDRGMAAIVLSTLSVMNLAIKLYSNCGYTLIKEEIVPVDKILGEGDWEPVSASHFRKLLH